MANRICCTALTGRIMMGRTNAAGNAFVGQKTDVTSDFCKALIDKAEHHGGCFEIVAGSEKWDVTVTKFGVAPAAAVAPAEDADTVDVVGVRANGEHVSLGKMPMPPRMKAREIATSQFGGFQDGDGSDAELCFGAMKELLEWLERQQPAAAPTQEADGWMPIETAPDGERVLLGPRHAPVVGTVHRPAFWEEEQEPTATVVHYNGNVLVAGYRCSEWHRLPGSATAQEADPWEDINTLPNCDDLVWLYCQDTNTIDGPVAPRPHMAEDWTHWCPAEAPSTQAIDAARARQEGAQHER